MKLKKILTTMLTFLPIWNLEGKNNSSDYKPFGQEANATGTEKYAFTGQYSEADIGLYYFGARWYDASLGRFISEDPIKGSMISSQSQNPYVYCMNNPLRYVDPTGMACQHEFRDGHWVDLYENGTVSSDDLSWDEEGQMTGSGWAGLSSRAISNILKDFAGDLLLWQYSDSSHSTISWHGKYGAVTLSGEGISWEGFNGFTNYLASSPSGSFKWNELGMKGGAYTPKQFFEEFNRVTEKFNYDYVGSQMFGAAIGGLNELSVISYGVAYFSWADKALLFANVLSLPAMEQQNHRGVVAQSLISIQYGEAYMLPFNGFPAKSIYVQGRGIIPYEPY